MATTEKKATTTNGKSPLNPKPKSHSRFEIPQVPDPERAVIGRGRQKVLHVRVPRDDVDVGVVGTLHGCM